MFVAALIGPAQQLAAQPADTASAGYKMGYYFGAWLPFLAVGLVFLIIFLSLRRRHGKE